MSLRTRRFPNERLVVLAGLGGASALCLGLELAREHRYSGDFRFLVWNLILAWIPLLLALGLFTPIAAWGTMWLSANIIMEKSFVSHGAYVDKTYFVVELFCLLSRSGLVYGLDAALAPYMPAGLASTLVGTTRAELRSSGVRSAQPAGLSPA